MISLNYRDSRPIYEQIRDGLRKLIVTGALSADEKLPSVRALAAQLAINPNTIQRAYELLEAEGYVSSVPGKGSFAAPHHQVDSTRRDGLLRVFDDAAANAAADSARRAELLTQVRELLSELRYLGVSQQELLNLVKEASPS